MKPPFTLKYVLITPQMAAEWLKKNTRNRTLRVSAVQAFAGDMKAGEWIPNHQGIAFGESGTLLDGQHRLAAIVRANVSLPMMVFEDVPETAIGKRQKTMDTIDRGAARSIGDMLRLSHGIEHNEAFVAAVCAALIDLFTPTDFRARKTRMTMRQTLAVLEVCGGEIRWLCEHRPSSKGVNSAMVLAPFVIACKINKKHASELIEGFKTGAGLNADHPMLTLRNHVLGTRNVRGRDERMKFSRITMACLRAALNNQSAPRFSAPTVASYSDEMLSEWPALRQRITEILTSDAEPAAPTPVKLSEYAVSLLKAKEVSEKIHRRIKSNG